MGGGKKKYKKRTKYVPEEKKLGKFVEEKRETKEEDIKDLITLWKEKKKELENK